MLLARRRASLALTTFMALLAFAVPAGALTLDPTYGNGGVSPAFAMPAGPKQRYVDSAVRNDGSIAILMQARGSQGFEVYSVGADGKVDPAFGPSGVREAKLDSKSAVGATAIAAYPDGGVAIIGGRRRGLHNVSFITRLDRRGIQNHSLTRRFPVKAPNVTLGDVAVDPSGRVIVSFVVSGRRLGAARFNVDGSLDRSYGKLHGRAQNFVDFKRYYKPYLPVLPQGLALLPDGSAIIGGWVTTEFCDDPEECPAGAESTDEPMLIKLSPRGLRVPSFGGGKSDPTDHYSITSLFEPYDGSLSIQATTDGKILAALNTTVEQDDNPGDGQGWEADAPEITKIDASGRLDKSFGTNGQLTDPLFPAAAGYISSDKLQATGFSVSVSGSIALCGVNRRGVTIPGDPSHAQRPGFLQIVDPVSAADDAIPATNLTRTTSYTDEIEGCAWQSEGKLLAVDLNGTLTVSRYLP